MLFGLWNICFGKLLRAKPIIYRYAFVIRKMYGFEKDKEVLIYLKDGFFVKPKKDTEKTD